MIRKSYSIGERIGIASILLALILIPVNYRLVVWPLGIFILMVVIAPFFPRSQFFLPVISRGKSSRRAVALTFDDGPDPTTTALLLQLLDNYNAAATFFVIGEKAAAHPAQIQQILAHGHSIGNHSFWHDNLLLLKSAAYVRRDIEATRTVLKRHGIDTLAFRPPAGITSPRLERALRGSDTSTVNFSCRAFDRGNRRIQHLADNILKRVQADDIILLHATTPIPEALTHKWIEEIESILIGLRDQHFEVLPLAELINRPVMVTI